MAKKSTSEIFQEVDEAAVSTLSSAVALSQADAVRQEILTADGQIARTVLAVGFTTTGKVQGTSLGDGNVVEVYSSGDDFNNKNVLYREFMSRGEPICFTGLPNGAIIVATKGFYGAGECIDGTQESLYPLLSFGLSFRETFFFAFRDSNEFGQQASDRGFIHVVNGAIHNTVSLLDGSGAPVQGQENIALKPWERVVLETDGNKEYILRADEKIMAGIVAGMSNDDGTTGTNNFTDCRIIPPLTSDGITWPRFGYISALYDNTVVEWYVRDGAKSEVYESIQDTHWEAYFDNQDSAIGVLLTTPVEAPIKSIGQVIWESGGTTTGMSLVLKPDMTLELRFGSATSAPRITTAALNTGTAYAIVVEFDQTNDLISIFITQSATDLSAYIGGAAADNTLSNAQTDICGTGDTGIGAVSSVSKDIGGYQVAPDACAFQGTITSVQIGNKGLTTISKTYDFAAEKTTIDTRTVVSPDAPVDFDAVTGAADADYESNGATRIRATGVVTANSGADSSGGEATPLMPVEFMSQVVAQPLYIADSGDGGGSSVSIASPYQGQAKIYEWNDSKKALDLAYVVPLTRNNVEVNSIEDQFHPAAGQVANEATAAVTLDGQLNAGIIIADVPITVVVQNNNVALTPMLRSQNGTTTTSIISQADETLMLGVTPEENKVIVREGQDGILYKLIIDASGVMTEVA